MIMGDLSPDPKGGSWTRPEASRTRPPSCPVQGMTHSSIWYWVHLTLDTVNCTMSRYLVAWYQTFQTNKNIKNLFIPNIPYFNRTSYTCNIYGWLCVITVLFLWNKFYLNTNKINSRYVYIFSIKTTFFRYYEVLYVPPLASEYIDFPSLVSITFYDIGIPDIAPIFIQPYSNTKPSYRRIETSCALFVV